jgi:FkbM family methyltransferase
MKKRIQNNSRKSKMQGFLLILINNFVIRRFYFFIKPFFRNRSFTIKNGMAKGLKIKGRPGFVSTFLNIDIAGEEFLADLSLEGQTVYDIGAHIGIYTLFFARAVGSGGNVFAFEPNPDNYQELTEHIRINNFLNVIAKQMAIGSKKGKTTLLVPTLDSSRGSMSKETKSQILVADENTKSFEVDVDSLDCLITGDSKKPDFIKIDVEGAEIDVLQGAERILKLYKPKLFIEIHGSDSRRWVINARRIINFLTDMGYAIYGTESKERLSNSSSFNQIIKCGPIYCFWH